MDGVQINPQDLAKFQPVGSGNGSATANDSSYEDDELKELLKQKNKSLKAVERCAKMVVGMVDSQAKKSGYPGIGDDEYRDDYIEVGMIWLDEVSGDAENREKMMEFLKKAPGYAFGLLTTGAIARNVMHGIAQKKESKKSLEDGKKEG